jgi:hypothetical protein
VSSYSNIPTFNEVNISSNTGKYFFSIDASLNGKYIIAGGEHDDVYIYNQTKHTFISMIDLGADIWDIKFSYNSKRFIAGLVNG